MEYELGSIIFSRQFDSYDLNLNLGKVTLLVGEPQIVPEIDPEPNHNQWYCPYKITGIGSETVTVGYGIDPLDALLFGLKKAHIDLKFYAKVKKKTIRWLNQENLGLPESED